MDIAIIAVGRLKAGPERELHDRYASRFEASGRALGFGRLKLSELADSRAPRSEDRKRDETERLLAAAGQAQRVICLTETGRQVTSEAFAAQLGQARDDGASNWAFLIGGADGFDAALLKAAGCQTLSLGQMTYPHGLARVMLSEQLYRAVTILAGHPYHRGAGSPA